MREISSQLERFASQVKLSIQSIRQQYLRSHNQFFGGVSLGSKTFTFNLFILRKAKNMISSYKIITLYRNQTLRRDECISPGVLSKHI